MSKLSEKRNIILITALAGLIIYLLLMFAPFVADKSSEAGYFISMFATGYGLAFGMNLRVKSNLGGATETEKVPLDKIYIGFLFLFLIALILIGILLLTMKFSKDGKKVFLLNAISTVLSLVMVIMTFCSGPMSGGGIGLGWGAIVGGLVLIVVFLATSLLSLFSYREEGLPF